MVSTQFPIQGRLYEPLYSLFDRNGRFVNLRTGRQRNCEGRALAGLALYRDVTSHQAAELPADGES